MPLSHDENVHGKKTILDKMWGSYEQKFAQVKVLYMYMYTHPGKKLNFMGNELGMFREFDETRENDWFLLDYSRHAAFARYYKDLCKYITSDKCLCALCHKDCDDPIEDMKTLKDKVRKAWGKDEMKNAMHSSDSLENVKREKNLVFNNI